MALGPLRPRSGRLEAHFRPPLCELGEASRTPLREALELAGVSLPEATTPPPGNHRAAEANGALRESVSGAGR